LVWLNENRPGTYAPLESLAGKKGQAHGLDSSDPNVTDHHLCPSGRHPAARGGRRNRAPRTHPASGLWPVGTGGTTAVGEAVPRRPVAVDRDLESRPAGRDARAGVSGAERRGRARARRRAVPRPGAVHRARACDARMAERAALLHPAGRPPRGHARLPRGQGGGGVAERRVPSGYTRATSGSTRSTTARTTSDAASKQQHPRASTSTSTTSTARPSTRR
jgi:hypothetical protein